MGANISARFTKNDNLYNGLDHRADALLKEAEETPGVVHTAVISYRVKFGKRDFENGGAENATIRVLQIEPVEGGDAEAVKKIQRKAFQARTGNPMQEGLFDLKPGGDVDDEDEDE